VVDNVNLLEGFALANSARGAELPDTIRNPSHEPVVVKELGRRLSTEGADHDRQLELRDRLFYLFYAITAGPGRYKGNVGNLGGRFGPAPPGSRLGSFTRPAAVADEQGFRTSFADFRQLARRLGLTTYLLSPLVMDLRHEPPRSHYEEN
jgi:hypothetical protein